MSGISDWGSVGTDVGVWAFRDSRGNDSWSGLPNAIRRPSKVGLPSPVSRKALILRVLDRLGGIGRYDNDLILALDLKEGGDVQVRVQSHSVTFAAA